MYMHLPVPFQLVQPNYKKKQYFFLFLSNRVVRKNCEKNSVFSLQEGCSLSSKKC